MCITGEITIMSLCWDRRGQSASARPVRPWKHGVSFTLHQDSPVAPPDVMGAVHNAVNRKTEKGRVLGQEQTITVMEALKAVTLNGAYQIFEEDKRKH